MGKEIRKGKYALGKGPTLPCFAIRVDNKAVSIVTPLVSSNDKVSAIRKSKTGNVWKDLKQFTSLKSSICTISI